MPRFALSLPGLRRIPRVELLAFALLLAVPLVSWWIVGRGAMSLVSSPVAGLLLVANLLPAVAFVILLGLRLGSRGSDAAGGGRLHRRLVLILSMLACVPVVLTALTVSTMFQTGAQFWQSDRARRTFQSSIEMAREAQNLIVTRWADEARVMAGDVARVMQSGVRPGTPTFHDFFARQTFYRNLEQSILFRLDGEGLTVFDSFNPPAIGEVLPRLKKVNLSAATPLKRTYVDLGRDVVWAVTPVAGAPNAYIYVATSADAQFLQRQHQNAVVVLNEYNRLDRKSRELQFQFSLLFYIVSIVIIGAATWVAIALADRLVRPIDDLVGAARRVAAGDFAARVAQPRQMDEIGTLAAAFNAMTGQIEAQTGALVTANEQLDSRRALIEAVLSGVSAGVIAVDRERRVRLINDSAKALLRVEGATGRPLAELAPELDALLDGDAREAVVQLRAQGETRTLAVKLARADAGPVLTFDDITQQLLDQRRAAWSDVARRIAHEIKNPLTPIQLAAERLRRRYAKALPADDTVFVGLTETIVRQVGDLRRMVDEFSSFARMPKPIFRAEALLDIARQVLLLHEVAHGGIRFVLETDEPPPTLVCDRRQIGQALTNIVKNAVEAIEARGDGAAGTITLALWRGEGQVRVTLADDGIGLPPERDRIVEPYMTTRARGTGLGLAIVKKIVEEHFGTISFADRPGGGTIVTLVFDALLLSALDGGGPDAGDRDSGPIGEERRPAELTLVRK